MCFLFSTNGAFYTSLGYRPRSRVNQRKRAESPIYSLPLIRWYLTDTTRTTPLKNDIHAFPSRAWERERMWSFTPWVIIKQPSTISSLTVEIS